MKSTFLGAILFAVAIVNQVSAIASVYVDQATYDKYQQECKGMNPNECSSVPYCEVSNGT